MKKNILFLAAAFMAFAMTSCQQDEPIIIDEPTNVESSALVKSTSDLIGTSWDYTLTLTDLIGSDMYGLLDSVDFGMTFGLNFDEDYAHLTFPEDVIGLNVVGDGEDFTVEEIQGMDYTYTYDATTQTGTLSGGNLDEIEIPFSYDTTTDAIVIELMIANEFDEASAVPFQLVFHRAL